MAWESGVVETNGIRTNYIRTGGDKPALVIAHGITDTGATWTRAARELATSYDVIMYDQRGHGLSEAPAHGYTFSDYAGDLADLFVALDLDQAHVVGHSSGAAIATIFAAKNPAQVDTLILEDPAWGTAWGDWDTVKTGLAQWFLGIKKMSKPIFLLRVGKQIQLGCRKISTGGLNQSYRYIQMLFRQWSSQRRDGKML